VSAILFFQKGIATTEREMVYGGFVDAVKNNPLPLLLSIVKHKLHHCIVPNVDQQLNR
jgi:hypothetical protein